MNTYLITGASILDGEPTDVLIRDGVVARVSTSSTTGGARRAATGSTTEVVDGDRHGAAARARRPAHAPA